MLLTISDGVLGFLILVIVLPLLYLGVRLLSRISDAWTVYRLRPLAELIEGKPDGGYLKGHYRGHPVRVSFNPRYRLSGEYSDSPNRYLNGFLVEFYQVPGQQDWSLWYVESGGLLSVFSPSSISVSLSIQTADALLAQRLEQAGVLARVASLGGGTTHYQTLWYRPGKQAFFYTTDIAPKKLPDRDECMAHLQMLWQLAQLNQQMNPAPTVH